MFEESIAHGITNKICKKNNYSPYQKARIEYGLAILLVNLFKASAILLTSSFFFSLKDTLLAYVPYCFLRSSCLGYHAKRSWVCTIQSILAFSIVPCLIRRMNILSNSLDEIIIGVIFIGVLVVTAPSCTLLNPIKDEEKRRYLKIRSVLVAIVLILSSMVFSKSYSILFYYGITLAVVLTIPNTILEVYHEKKN